MQISCIIIFFMLQVASYENVKNIKWRKREKNLKGKCVADMSFRYRMIKMNSKAVLGHVIIFNVVAKWIPISAWDKINSRSSRNYSYKKDTKSKYAWYWIPPKLFPFCVLEAENFFLFSTLVRSINLKSFSSESYANKEIPLRGRINIVQEIIYESVTSRVLSSVSICVELLKLFCCCRDNCRRWKSAFALLTIIKEKLWLFISTLMDETEKKQSNSAGSFSERKTRSWCQ